MTIDEVESYYGKESADWVREKIRDGTFILSAVTVRLKNPKCQRGFMKFSDAMKVLSWESLHFELPDEVRYSDIVTIEMEGNT